MADKRPEYRVERSRMYAHIYFDLGTPGAALGIAVYGVARIPGFAGEPSQLVKKYSPDTLSAHELFVNTLQKEDEQIISADEIQQGKLFSYTGLGDKIKNLELWGRAQAQDPNANIVVDIDDPTVWVPDYAEVPPEEKAEVGDRVRRKYIEGLLKGPLTTYVATIKALKDENLPTEQRERIATAYQEARSGVESAMQSLYIVISRILNPEEGPKAYPKKVAPPTLLVSKKFNLAYYPGFRGSPYMSKQPRRDPTTAPSKSSYKHKDEPGKYWHQLLISNVDSHLEPHTTESVRVEVLDQITEVLARQFYQVISRSPTPSMELKIADFNEAVVPVTNKANELLAKIDESDIREGYKKASRYISTWIDLQTGEIFDTLPELLAAKQHFTEHSSVQTPGVEYANHI